MRKLLYILLLAVGCTMASCVHDTPEDGGVDPTLINVTTTLKFDLELLPIDIDVTRTSAQSDMQPRIIVEAYIDGSRELREVVLYDMQPEQTSIELPLELKLNALDYDLMVWVDYVERGSDEDYFYNTSDLSEVTILEPYRGSTDYRDCIYGKANLDLRDYRDQWSVNLDLHIDMVRPLAKYQIIATDVDEFLTTTGSEGGEYTARFSYGFYIPMGYYLIGDVPINSKEGVSFTAPVTIERNEANEVLLGSDFIFAGGIGSFTILNIDIMDSSGKVISRAYGIEIPYEYKHLTTLRARILTNEIADSGVGFDPDWEGDLDFDLDKFM